MKIGIDNAEPRRRRAKWLAAAAVASVPLVGIPAMGAAAPAAGAADFELLPPGPARVLTLSVVPGGNDDDLQGVMCQSPRACQTVEYAYLFRPSGVASLDKALLDGTTGHQMVFAYSQGARVVALWLEQNAATEGGPPADDLTFVLIGNPGRKYGGADGNYNTIPDTAHKILDVTREYDPASDFPNAPLNLLALANANAAFLFIHQDYEDVDISDAANYVWKDGNTTYVFVPTENLPLLQPLRWMGLSRLADKLNGPLKEIVDRAYDRHYLPDAPGLPAPAPEPEPEPEEPPAAPVAAPVSRSAQHRAVDSIVSDESQIGAEAPSDVEDVVEEPAADDSGESADDDSASDPSTEDATESESGEEDEQTAEPSRPTTSTEDDSPSPSTDSSSAASDE